MGQRLLLSLPAVAAAIVAWALLSTVGGRVRYVQVLGGPTAAVSSVLVRSLELDRDGRRVASPNLALRVMVQGGATPAGIVARSDERGELELRFDGAGLPAADPWLRVESAVSAELLAEGRLSLDPGRWRTAARQNGGWLSGQTRGALRVRVAAESGTFAVPFEGALMVQVQEPPAGEAAGASGGERPSAGAGLQVELDGATLARPPPATSAAGLSRVALRPDEHAVAARVVARLGDRQGEWYGTLPVTPGALLATRDGSALLVRSPIVRERAFVSIVTRNERIAGAIVSLSAADDGGSSGRVALDREVLDRIEHEPSWAVVSSEYDKRSAGAVGWPLSPGFDPAAPRLTFDVADSVLLDGGAEAIHAAERERSGRRRGAALALLGVGLLMSATFWKEVRRARICAPRDDTDGTLDRTPLAPRGWLLGVALACIVLGLAGLAYFALSR